MALGIRRRTRRLGPDTTNGMMAERLKVRSTTKRAMPRERLGNNRGWFVSSLPRMEVVRSRIIVSSATTFERRRCTPQWYSSCPKKQYISIMNQRASSSDDSWNCTYLGNRKIMSVKFGFTTSRLMTFNLLVLPLTQQWRICYQSVLPTSEWPHRISDKDLPRICHDDQPPYHKTNSVHIWHPLLSSRR